MYNRLYTKPIQKGIIQKIPLHIIKSILIKCYTHISFSTFPYIYNKYSSKKSLTKTNSGNCIALSMCVQEELSKKNIQSFLIPCTIPKHYYLDGYLDISHVALCVPISDTIYYIIDPAFYFLEPIIMDITKHKNKNIQSSDIYTNTNNILYSTTNKTESRIVYNTYQSIPKNTYYCEACYEYDISEKWKYFLRQIVNPDKAITTFFIAIKNEPFYMSTTYNNNALQQKEYITYKNNKIKIYDMNRLVYHDTIENIPKNIKEKYIFVLYYLL